MPVWLRGSALLWIFPHQSSCCHTSPFPSTHASASVFIFYIFSLTKKDQCLTDLLRIISSAIKERQTFKGSFCLLKIPFQRETLTRSRVSRGFGWLCVKWGVVHSHTSVWEFSRTPLSPINRLVLPHVSRHLLIWAALLSHYLRAEVASRCLAHSVLFPSFLFCTPPPANSRHVGFIRYRRDEHSQRYLHPSEVLLTFSGHSVRASLREKKKKGTAGVLRTGRAFSHFSFLQQAVYD